MALIEYLVRSEDGEHEKIDLIKEMREHPLTEEKEKLLREHKIRIGDFSEEEAEAYYATWLRNVFEGILETKSEEEANELRKLV